MQVTVPADASGSASFQYQANDGCGGTATAKVTLTVKDRGSNEAPAQERVPTLLLEQGKSRSGPRPKAKRWLTATPAGRRAPLRLELTNSGSLNVP